MRKGASSPGFFTLGASLSARRNKGQSTHYIHAYGQIRSVVNLTTSAST